MTATKIVKDVVGAGILLGAGNNVLGQMGQGQIAQGLAPAGNMLGTVASAGLGMEVLRMVNNATSRPRNKDQYRL